MDITVAVSGGVDSLYALVKLREDGHKVRAVHARLVPFSGTPASREMKGLDGEPPESRPDPVPGLYSLCRELELELTVVDLRTYFDSRIVMPFVTEYSRARTPNPCAQCNRLIKFGRLFELALNGREPAFFATGHYAGMDEHPLYGRSLRSGMDKAKDQSYFLALTPAERLARSLFPLAGTTKPENRQWLKERGFKPPLPGESQEICFVPDDDYRSFLKGRKVKLPGPGPIVLHDPAGHPGRVIGQHKGLWHYTEGQRKGLGIAWSEPLFVLEKDRARNALVVGAKPLLERYSCTAGTVNLMVEPELWPATLFVRTRYRQTPQEAVVRHREGMLEVEFAIPQPLAAPGQILAVYDGEGFVLAGGVLE